jgi:hypothetical protein
MRKIEFKLNSKSKANQVYLVANFEGGDADTSHPQEYLMPFPFSEWESNVDLIKKEYDELMILKTILGDYDISYNEVKEQWGEDIARLYDNVPNDPQTDYSVKCYLDDVYLIGYDEECNEFKAYL